MFVNVKCVTFEAQWQTMDGALAYSKLVGNIINLLSLILNSVWFSEDQLKFYSVLYFVLPVHRAFGLSFGFLTLSIIFFREHNVVLGKFSITFPADGQRLNKLQAGQTI